MWVWWMYDVYVCICVVCIGVLCVYMYVCMWCVCICVLCVLHVCACMNECMCVHVWMSVCNEASYLLLCALLRREGLQRMRLLKSSWAIYPEASPLGHMCSYEHSCAWSTARSANAWTFWAKHPQEPLFYPLDPRWTWGRPYFFLSPSTYFKFLRHNWVNGSEFTRLELKEVQVCMLKP